MHSRVAQIKGPTVHCSKHGDLEGYLLHPRLGIWDCPQCRDERSSRKSRYLNALSAPPVEEEQ